MRIVPHNTECAAVCHNFGRADQQRQYLSRVGRHTARVRASSHRQAEEKHLQKMLKWTSGSQTLWNEYQQNVALQRQKSVSERATWKWWTSKNNPRDRIHRLIYGLEVSGVLQMHHAVSGMAIAIPIRNWASGAFMWRIKFIESENGILRSRRGKQW